PPGPGSATAVVSIPALGLPGQELERPDVAGADRASRGDAGIERSDWERAWVIILTCIGIGVEATARCRGRGRRGPRRRSRPSSAPLDPAPGPSGSSLSRTIPRFPFTWLRGVLRPGSLVTAAAKVSVGR